MKVLILETEQPNLRSEVLGWGEENSGLFVRNRPIGLTPGPKITYSPKTVLEALADGWKLLGPPQVENKRTLYTWWLTK
jgi:hypothetical protein